MPGAASTWWDDPATDWSTGAPERLVDVLSFAYPSPEDIRHISRLAGLDWTGAPEATSMREVCAWVLRRASSAGRVLDLVAEVLYDPRAIQFRSPLTALLGDRLGEVYARVVFRYGLPPAPASGPDPVAECIAATELPAGNERGELQAITGGARAGMGDPRAAIQPTLDLLARTALIEVAGQPAGTGFLVGEDLVLTAAHVFDTRSWPPNPLRDAHVVFDFEFSGRSYAETGTRVGVAEYVTGSLPTSEEAAGAATAIWDAPADRLDFALIKLAKPVPRGLQAAPRGHYPLAGETYDFSATRDYLLMEHPLGDFIKLTRLTEAPVLSSPGGTRIRYGGNTLQGASGSPVVDHRGRLVALHHYATGTHNQGVPISKIAAALMREHAALFGAGATAAPSDAVAELDPFATSAVLRTRPFVNRGPLRGAMRAMTQRDGVRTLAIKGESGTGVSYSYLLASHVASHSALCPTLRDVAPGGLKTLKIDLRTYVNVGVDRVRHEIALKLMLELGLIESPADPLAQEARETIRLVDMIGAKLRRSDEQWWFFFDSIDNPVAVKQGEVDELIHALIELADDAPLRVVIAGRGAEEFVREHTDWAEQDRATGLTRGEVEQWLRSRAAEEGRALDETRLAVKLDELFPSPGPVPDARRLGPRLPRILFEVLDG